MFSITSLGAGPNRDKGKVFVGMRSSFSLLLSQHYCSHHFAPSTAYSYVVHHFGIFVKRWSLVMETQL